jgi:hypothetical protein
LGAGVLSVAPASATAAGWIDSVGGTGILGSSTSTIKLQTATMLSSGTLALTSTSGGYYVVSSGAYVAALLTDGDEGDTTPAVGIDADQAGVTAGTTDVIKVRATGAAGSTFTVTGYSSSASSTVVDKITVTIAAASVAGTAVAANSLAVWTAPVADGATITTPTMSTATDSTNASTTTGNVLVAQIMVRDAYKNVVTAASTAITATASAGAVVKIVGSLDQADTVAASVGTGALAVASAHANDVIVVTVAEATAGAGWSGTLTVNYKGVDVAVKTGKISGDVAKLTALSTTVVSTTAGFKGIAYTVTDAAGNPLAYASSNVKLDSSSKPSVISGITVTAGTGAAADTNLTGDINARAYANYVGTVTPSCSLAGSSSVVLYVINDSGVVIKSNPVTVNCGGAAATYTAALDKAVFTQGELAKLTLTFKDKDGNLASSYSTVGSASSTIASPMMDRVGGATLAASQLVNAAGQLTHTFTVGSTASFTPGAYNMVVNYTDTLTAASAQTVAYTISGSGVTNADVLKAIVSLIASINKQIAALQKALLKK